MVKCRELSELERKAIETLSKEGKTERQIAEQLEIAKTNVHNTLVHIRKYKTVKNLKRSGRRRKTTTRIDRKIITLAENSEAPNAVDIAKQLSDMSLCEISPSTVRNRLYENNLHGRAVIKKPLLTKKHIKRRLEFAFKYQNWTKEDWKRVLWSDETKICLHGSDGRIWTWRRPNESLKPNQVKRIIKHDKSVMVWGCFSWNGVGKIHIIEDKLTSPKYVRILAESMIPSAQELFQGKYIFQQDNDPKHTAKNTKSWLERKNIEVLDWPPNSPDFNPIENLWYQLKIEIGKLKITKISDLADAIETCWNSINKDRCKSLVESMPNRIDELIKNKGGWIKY